MIKHQQKALAALLAAAGFAGSALVAGAQTTQQPLPSTTPGPAANTMPSGGATPQANAGQLMAAPDGAMAPPASDADFVRMFAAANNEEVLEARLAARRSKNPLVQQFAQRMIDDHTTANVELDAAARKAEHRYAVPLRAGTPDAIAEYRTLDAIAAPSFDAAYMADQVPDHNAAVALVKWEIANGKDAVIKDYAVRMQPHVLNHLAMAQAFLATNGQSLTVDAAGLAVGHGGAGATGVNPPPKAPNGTTSNNAATAGNGQTNAPDNLGGSVRPNSPQSPSQAAPAEGPGAAASPSPRP